MNNAHSQYIAVVLAAGSSTRMGESKLSKPWHGRTIIETVIATITSQGIKPIVVLGKYAQEIRDALIDQEGITFALNQNSDTTEMLASVQVGLGLVSSDYKGAFIVLGDQPQVTNRVYKALIERITSQPEAIIIPTFQRRRGHPWWLPNRFFGDLLTMEPPKTLRDFQLQHRDAIIEVSIQEDTILRDIDTPEDYRNEVERE